MNPVAFSPAYANRTTLRPGLAGVRMGEAPVDWAEQAETRIRGLGDLLNHANFSQKPVTTNTPTAFHATYDFPNYTLTLDCKSTQVDPGALRSIEIKDFPYELTLELKGGGFNKDFTLQFSHDGSRVNVPYPNYPLDLAVHNLMQNPRIRQTMFDLMIGFLQDQNAQIVKTLNAAKDN